MSGVTETILEEATPEWLGDWATTPFTAPRLPQESFWRNGWISPEMLREKRLREALERLNPGAGAWEQGCVTCRKRAAPASP